MAGSTSKEDKISLKLMMHKEKNKVIFAEADNKFVDILFSFMTLPLGTIVRILGKCPDQKVEALGSLKNLYNSLINLPTSYLSTEESKVMMLNPRSSSYDQCKKLKLNIDDTEPLKYFICQNLACSRYSNAVYSSCKSARCSNCGNIMNLEISFKNITANANTGGDGGVFVSQLTNFIVTDDLRVMPNTSKFCIQLLCDSGITDLSQLEERTFDIGSDQILIFLKGVLLVNFPLTYLVFPSTYSKGDLFNLKHQTSIQPLIGNEASTNSKRMILKVNLQKSTSKFLFAEAEEDFVDFVFGFLEIPLGTVIGNLMNGNTLQSLDNLFTSISNMEVGKYIKSQDLKDLLVKPQLEHKYLSQNQILPLSVSKGSQLYCHFYSSGNKDFAYLTQANIYFGYSNESLRCLNMKDPRVLGSYLKASAKFMLMDDLVITPLSSFSIVALLNKLKVPVNDVVEHELSIGIEEGLKILKASLVSSLNCLSTLTDALPKGNAMK